MVATGDILDAVGDHLDPLAAMWREITPPRGPRLPRGRGRPLAKLLEEADSALFTLLLRPLPVGFEDETAALGAELQLSGHTHDGQLWPFRCLVRLSFRHTAGLARSGASLLYVSRGTGTWGPPLRFLAPPEVTLFEFVPAN